MSMEFAYYSQYEVDYANLQLICGFSKKPVRIWFLSVFFMIEKNGEIRVFESHRLCCVGGT